MDDDLSLPGPSGTQQSHNRRNRDSSSSTSSSSSSSSSKSSRDSKKNKKKTRRRVRRARERSVIRKLAKQVSTLRKDFESFDHSAYPPPVHDEYISDISGDLYEVECDELQPRGPDPVIKFNIETKVKEPAVPATPQEYLHMLNEVQRFDNISWSEVRYADTQKIYNHSPGFTELETNEEVRAYDTLRHLAYSDKAYAALTFCILKQKEVFLNGLCDLLKWSKLPNSSLTNVQEKVQELFLSGDYLKVSNDLLQLACGHRAEAIEMRRDSILKHVRDPLIKSSLNKIPPTNTHIFNSVSFATVLEKAGGVRKAFWPLNKSGVGNASRAKPHNNTNRGPSQGYATQLTPSRGVTGQFLEPNRGQVQWPYYQPSQGGYPSQDPSQGYNNNYNPRDYNSNNRGSFRSRGSRPRQVSQRGRKRSYSLSGHKNKRSRQ